MNVVAQAALIFGVCLAGEGIAAILPVKFPASVIALILLTILLMTRVVKPRHIEGLSKVMLANMALFFVPVCTSVMDKFVYIKPYLLPFLLICVVTTPVVFLITAWTVQLVLKLQRRKGAKGHA